VSKFQLSVVIPTLNEQGNIAPLITRLDDALSAWGIEYELIFIDDKSDDETRETIESYSLDLPVGVHTKQGRAGKAHSLLEGFQIAQYDTIAMIDADLQYPPEAVPEMAELIFDHRADIVVANRLSPQTSLLRRSASRTFRSLFGKLLWRLDVDVQSGLKVFKRDILERLKLSPEGWTFDLDFLVQSRNAGYEITGYDIEFAQRVSGDAKLNVLRASMQIAKSAIKLRIKPRNYIPLSVAQKSSEGNGFHYRGEKYITHNQLELKDTAVERTTLIQRVIMVTAVGITLVLLALNWHRYLLLAVSLLTLLYFADLLFNLLLIYRSYFHYSELTASEQEMNEVIEWPRYTVLCPLYKEAQVAPQFIAAMKQLDYPKDKLEVLLLLEADDKDTIAEILTMDLPDFMQIVVVPEGMPKTKPKACNYGLQIATGEYSVIFDAEDIPAADQLKKAVVAFQKADVNVACIQAKLNYYNWNQNLLTRLFALEYSLWFDLILTGLQSIGAPIPLGGTSNHFRTATLRSLGGWDPFNVTEDADLGMRIAKRGMVTAVLDSTTMEEANSQFKNWLKQRSRWIKGYMQTYLVHMRELRQFSSGGKRINMLTFQLVIGGKILSMLINPLLWLTTLAYFILRPEIGGFIQSLYITPIFYIGIVSLVLGNMIYLYTYMMGAARRHQPELIIYTLFVPVYWLMMSWAAAYAFHDLIVRPFHWHKTQHGLHLGNVAGEDAVEQLMAGNAS
jgi:cellulose synthase/poly-beta-1,6-N-acetylglucosamine synthase-like glycosyltransferase